MIKHLTYMAFLMGFSIHVAAQSLNAASDPKQVQAIQNSNKAAMNAIDRLEGSAMPIGSQNLNVFLNNAQQGTPVAPKKELKSDLIIFISLSMPEDAIKGYARQAKAYGATLMIRGFVDDKLSATRDAAVRLDQLGAPWQVNPQAFTKFKIDKVPAIVLANNQDSSLTEEGCAQPGTYSTIYGDVQIDFALNKFYERSNKVIAQIAKDRIADFTKANSPASISR